MDKTNSNKKSFGETPLFAEPITDADISHEEFLKIKQRFEEMQAIAQFGTWDWDIKNDQYLLSDGACNIYGLDPKANILDYESIAGFIHPDDREAARAALRAAMDKKMPYSLDYRVIRSDGEVRHVHEYGSAVYSNGVPVRAFGSIKDNTENMKMQDKLKESELMYRTLFEKTVDAFLIVELIYDTNGKACDFRNIKVNDRFEEHTGINPSIAVGRLASEAEPGIEPYWFETLEKVAEAGKPTHYQNFHKGTNRWYDVYCFPYTQGQIGVILRDITQYKTAEEALNEANESNRQILDSINDGYGMFSKDGTVLRVGNKFAKRFGKTPEECVGMNLKDYTPGKRYEDLWGKRKGYISKVFETGKAVEFQDTRDGVWYNHRCYPVFKDGKVNAVSIISTDITDRKKAEEETLKNAQLRLEAEILREKEREYLELLDGAEEGMRIVDLRKKSVEFSRKWAQRLGITGFSQEELFKNERKLIHADDWERVLGERHEAGRKGLPVFTQEYRILTADSDYIWILDRGKILYDENGAAVKIYASSLDITERKRREINARLLNGIEDDFSRVSLPEELMASLGETARRHFGISRLTFYEVDQDSDTVTGIFDDHDEGLASALGPRRLSDYIGLDLVMESRNGRVIVSDNVLCDPRFASRTDAYSKTSVRSQMVASFVKDGKLRFIIIAQHTEPRHWREDEIELLGEFAARIFPQVERALAEAALRKSEESYRRLFEHMLGGFVYCQMLYDEQGRPDDFVYLAVNEAFGKLTGLTDVVGKRVTQIIPQIKEQNPELFEIYSRVASMGVPERFEIYFKPLGLYFLISVYCPHNGYFVAVFDDITERKRAEEALRKALLREKVLGGITSRLLESEDPQAVMEDICREAVGYIEGDVFFNYICEGGRLHLNACSGIPAKEAENLEWLGYGEAICGCVARDGERIVVTDMQTSADPGVQTLKSFGVRCYASFPLKSDDHVIGTLAFGSSKRDAFAEDELLFLRSVSEHVAIAMNRLMITRALRESEEKYRELVKYAPAGIYDIDLRSRRFQSVNDIMCNLSGYSREELLTIDPFDILDEQSRARFQARISNWLSGGDIESTVEYKVKAKDGSMIDVLLDVSFTRDENGDPLGATVIAHDITERKKDEALINRQNNVLHMINQIHEEYVSCGTMHELGQACLDIVNAVTGSSVSIIGELEEDGQLYETALSLGVWQDGMQDRQFIHKHGGFKAGLFKGVIDNKMSLLTNDPSSHPDSISIPDGHIKISSFLGVPFIRDGKVLGLIAAINREGGYTEDEKEILEALAPTICEVMLRKRTEEALIESESKYEMLVKYAPAGIYEMDFRARRFTSVNDALCRMSGYSREELLEIDPAVFMDERSKTIYLSRVELWMRGKKPRENVDYKIKTKDGREIFVSLDVSYTKDAEGNPLGATGIVHDITQRRKDEALINRKNRILQVINHIHEASVSCGTMNELEAACLDIVNAVTGSGVSFIGELKGEKLMYEISLISGTQAGTGNVHRRLGRLTNPGLFKDVIDNKASLLISGELLCPGVTGVSGSEIEVFSFLGVPFIRDGKAVGLIAAANREGGYSEEEKEMLEALVPTVYEVLMRKRAEEALIESEERLAAEFNAVTRIQKISASFVQEGDFESILYNILKAAIMISGAYKGTLQLLRPGTEHLEIAAQLGFDQSYIGFYSSVSRDSDRVCKKALEQEERVIIEDVTKSPIFINTPALDVQLAAGVRAMQSTPLISRRGKVIGILSTYWDRPCYPSDDTLRYIDLLAGQAADVIERKRAEEELKDSEECALALVKKLEDADRNKNDFLSSLSHEIRNPLATISAGLQLMDISHDENHIKNAKEIINRQMDQLCSLVDDLLDLTRISNNKIELKKQRIELGMLVSFVAKDHMLLADKKGLKLETQLGEDIYIDADPVRIKQIIGNLLQNAFKFTEAGTITLSVYEESGKAVICVKDTGIGINPENLSRIFEPFMQLDSHIDMGNGGLGLGLSIVKAIAILHGGDAGVYSEGEGTGSKFYIKLPIIKNEAGGPEEITADTAQVCLKVLVIEDNRDYSEMMCELLKFLGHDVTSAPDGIEGIKKAKEFMPDLIICDIGMPGINGFETAKRLREDENLKNVFLASVTGYAGPRYAEDARKAGFDLHITKPADIGALKRIINEASNKRHP